MPSGNACITRAYVGLGSNVQDPAAQVRRALRALAGVRHTRLVLQSSLYRSAPMGPADQPDFINAVAALDTFLTPHQLLAELMAIERSQGRIRGPQRWGPRTLDLDLLVCGDTMVCDHILTLPHPGMLDRNFVLYPLVEIAPDLVLPGDVALAAALEKCSQDGLEIVE